MKTTSVKPVRAFLVTIDDCEGLSQIVFATSRGQAVSRSDWEGSFVDAEVRRAREFDRFAELGYVPVMALLEAGWWHGCAGCERRLELDDEDADSFVNDGANVYCSHACMLRRYADIGKRYGLSFGARLDAVERWPWIEIIDSTGLRLNERHEQVGSVRFRFPNGLYPGDWVRGEDTALISKCDVEAWQRNHEGASP